MRCDFLKKTFPCVFSILALSEILTYKSFFLFIVGVGYIVRNIKFYIPFESSFFALQDVIKKFLIPLFWEKRSRVIYVNTWIFCFFHLYISINKILIIILDQFWLFYDKIQPFAEKGAQFQLLSPHSNAVVIFWKKLPRAQKTPTFDPGAEGSFFIFRLGTEWVDDFIFIPS